MIVCHARPQYSLRMLFLVMTLAGPIMPAIVNQHREVRLQKLTEEFRLALEEGDKRGGVRTSSYSDQAFKAVIALSEEEQAQLQNGPATDEKDTCPVADAHSSH